MHVCACVYICISVCTVRGDVPHCVDDPFCNGGDKSRSPPSLQLNNQSRGTRGDRDTFRDVFLPVGAVRKWLEWIVSRNIILFVLHRICMIVLSLSTLCPYVWSPCCNLELVKFSLFADTSIIRIV